MPSLLQGFSSNLLDAASGDRSPVSYARPAPSFEIPEPRVSDG